MNVLITTYGSRGDVQPYVALGRGLQNAGHQVTLATSVRFRDFVEEHGLTYGLMNDDLLAILDTDQGKDLLENTRTALDIVKQNVKLSKQVKPLQEALMRECWEVAQRFRPDFILYHPKTPAGPHIAEKLDVGCALATPVPMFVPTAEWAFPVLPKLKLGGWYNRLSYHVITSLTGMLLRGYITSIRREMGLPPLSLRKTFHLLKKADGKEIPVLHPISNAVLPRPADWPESASMTGYWFLDSEPDWTPPQALSDFLASGAPPVYVGFGSMAGRHPGELTRTVVEALQQAGLRGIVATGWGGLAVEGLPESILGIEGAPHNWLFPRVSAVVHHGGAGTTAAALRAGKASVIVPFLGDQPFWGLHVHSLGAGTEPIPLKKLTAEKLAAALKEATNNLDLRERARSIGEQIRQEDGIRTAVELIERLAT